MNQKLAISQFKKLSKTPTKQMRLAAESWKSPFKTLIATILSSQTRDEMTISISQKLFQNYPNAKSLSSAKITNIQKIIKPINYYKTKSKHIKETSIIINKNRGKISDKIEDLTKYPGVGRKVANVFLSEIHKKPSIAVDTHVARISQKLEWTKNTNPKKIEQDLLKLFPKEYWNKINPTLVRFGKTYTSKKKENEILEQIKE